MLTYSLWWEVISFRFCSSSCCMSSIPHQFVFDLCDTQVTPRQFLTECISSVTKFIKTDFFWSPEVGVKRDSGPVIHYHPYLFRCCSCCFKWWLKLLFCHLNSNCFSNPPLVPDVFTENIKPYLLNLAFRPKTYLSFKISIFLCFVFLFYFSKYNNSKLPNASHGNLYQWHTRI